MASRIEDYALIGDFPRFDSAAYFAALLGTPDRGRWVLAPEKGDQENPTPPSSRDTRI
jgi:hypothetical protein